MITAESLNNLQIDEIDNFVKELQYRKGKLLDGETTRQHWSLIDNNNYGRLPMSSFNHIAREVLDLERSKQFYVDILGFKVIPRPNFSAEGYWLHGYGLNLHLVATADQQARKNVKIRRIKHFSWALPRVDHIAFVSDNMASIFNILNEANVYYMADCPKETGISQIFFFDPDGNVIEVSNCAPEIGHITCTENTNIDTEMESTAEEKNNSVAQSLDSSTLSLPLAKSDEENMFLRDLLFPNHQSDRNEFEESDLANSICGWEVDVSEHGSHFVDNLTTLSSCGSIQNIPDILLNKNRIANKEDTEQINDGEYTERWEALPYLPTTNPLP